MTKIYGVHVVELREGVSSEEFEDFVLKNFLPALDSLGVPGVKFHLLKGDRGSRSGKYLFVILFDNPAIRNQYFPDMNHPSEELLAITKPLYTLSKTWEALSERKKTDYLQLD